ncbi:MAG: hypothetical protein H6541_06185 [Lentimicrobiaceae bacterium]|nr:hypothetical protein [Lentimicrobiaceae bacterium]MCB9023311.1 hypothetical protein [Lentimicrobiaceae bacterium]MCO5265719.1 hypothetical protein [Lentimicrobium sp.]
MRKYILPTLTAIAMITGTYSCKNTSKVTESAKMNQVAAPQVFIYKTKADYQQQVPVILSSDKSTLVSYPAPGDVFYNGDLAYPVQLENGYLLDRRGINKDCAFLKWTYYEYSRLDHTPSQPEIMEMILDKDPLTELYNCGKKSNYTHLEAELNEIIKKGELSKFKKIK